MKSRTLTCITAITLFAVLAIQVRPRPGAQGQTTNFRHYKLIDMGTFGGPESFINEPRFSYPALNARGGTVGGSANSTPTLPASNTLVCGGIDGVVPFVNHTFRWQNGIVTNLGALPPVDENCSNAASVNAKGEIVGSSENGDLDPLTGVNQTRAVRWKDGEITDLGSFRGNQNGASGINNRGQIVGFSLNTIPDLFSLFDCLLGSCNGTQTRAALWWHGQMQDLGTLGGNDAAALFINERGQIAGSSYTNSTPNSTTGTPTVDPFIWEHAKMVDLGTLGGTSGGPTALNNLGQVIGQSNLAGDKTADPFLWDGVKLIDLNTDTIGGNPLGANALNDAGEVVGTAAFPDRPIADAYLWRQGVATDLGTVGGDCFSEAFAINSRKQVVGQSYSCASNILRAFLWENGSIVDLNSLIPPSSGLQLAVPEAINDRGEIVGNGAPPGCPDYTACGRAFLLIPVCADGTEGCADAPLDPAVVAQSRAASGVAPKTMTAGELATFKERIARMTGRSRGFGLWPRKIVLP